MDQRSMEGHGHHLADVRRPKNLLYACGRKGSRWKVDAWHLKIQIRDIAACMTSA
jgi:hypothetical protein